MFGPFRIASISACIALAASLSGSFAADTLSAQSQKKAASAGPKIEFENKTVNCGEFLEGKVEKIDAVFVVKNTGDQPLKLQSVKPGCGCTVVKFDSTIQPGKSINIESSVNVTGYHAGNVNKGITVTSDAVNEPVSRLTITATILPIIEVSERFVRFDSTTAKTGCKVSLSTKKTDFKVTDVVFKTAEESFPVKFTLTQIKTADDKGMKKYELTLQNPTAISDKTGDLLIKTNHAEKAEFTIRSRIH